MKIHRALVVYNKPLYELHILEEKDPYFVKLLRKKHPTTRAWKKIYEQHHKTLEGIRRTLNLLGISTDTLFRRRLRKIKNYDLIVTVGGDGTFLDTSHLLKNQVLLGVNAAPVDSTGALCRAQAGNFLQTMVNMLSGDLKPKKIPRLKIRLGGRYLPEPVLNEVLFANQSPAGTSRYLIQHNKHQEEHKSSGIWIATSTGSTAAIRSAGGVSLPPERAGMQLTVREPFPVKGKKLKILKGVLPKKTKLVLYSKMRQGALFIDGNHIVYPVAYGQRIEVTADATPLRAIL